MSLQALGGFARRFPCGRGRVLGLNLELGDT